MHAFSMHESLHAHIKLLTYAHEYMHGALLVLCLQLKYDMRVAKVQHAGSRSRDDLIFFTLLKHMFEN